MKLRYGQKDKLTALLKPNEKGVKFGAQKKLTDEQIKEQKKKRSEGVLIKSLMQE